MRSDRDESSHGLRHGALAPEPTASCSVCSTPHRNDGEPALPRLSREQDRTGGVHARGFHALSERGVSNAVGETSPGNFALGYVDGSEFAVFYVGRSDSDVSESLRAWVDAPSLPRHRRWSPQAPWHLGSGPRRGGRPQAFAEAPAGIDTSYTHFAFCYAPSAVEAFERECHAYHELGGSQGLDNRRHPEPPEGSPWACPIHG